ncbi:MAG: hypothetical protein JWQ40_4467 [Segetibacter sp.]|nr:hypothetical protein [Segetibacter sp.]
MQIKTSTLPTAEGASVRAAGEVEKAHSFQPQLKESGSPIAIQYNLLIGGANDYHEQEADAISETVTRMPLMPLVQRTCAQCRDQDEQVNRKPLASIVTPFIHAKSENGLAANNDVSNRILASKGGGSSLDDSTKSFMESRFGADFSDVRIHNNNDAANMSAELQAKAFTVGSDIYFNSGTYSSESSEGRKLLAHELTHTIQQGAVGSTKIQPFVQRQAAAVPRRTIWVNVGFDSSAQANEETMTKLRASISVEKAAMLSCCSTHATGCNIDVKTNYDWVRHNKPAPADRDYDNDNAADRTLRDTNLGRIAGPAGGLKVLVTESTLSQTWQGARIFPRANTGASGVLWNRGLAANDTIAHEAGHAAGYVGDDEGGAHSSDAHNLMSPGSIRLAGAAPDQNWCTQMAATAQS